MQKTFRRWLIKQGLIKPTLKEAQATFKFPIKLKEQKVNNLGLMLSSSIHQASRVR